MRSTYKLYSGIVAGLSVLRSSNLLKNPQDQLEVGVFNPAVPGKTSKFVVLYQK